MIGKTHSFGRLFVCFSWQGAGSPLIDDAMTWEKEGKKRKGKSKLIRMPFTGYRPTIGLCIGIWGKHNGKRTKRLSEQALHSHRGKNGEGFALFNQHR